MQNLWSCLETASRDVLCLVSSWDLPSRSRHVSSRDFRLVTGSRKLVEIVEAASRANATNIIEAATILEIAVLGAAAPTTTTTSD